MLEFDRNEIGFTFISMDQSSFILQQKIFFSISLKKVIYEVCKDMWVSKRCIFYFILDELFF